MVHKLRISFVPKGVNSTFMYTIIPMQYNNEQHIAAIIKLEQQCIQYDQFNMKSNIEHLMQEDGDHALLCYDQQKLIGLLSWFNTDGVIAQVDAMVHPDYRRQGVFHRLLQRAQEDMKLRGLHKICYRVPKKSVTGHQVIKAYQAALDRSEYSMSLVNMELKTVNRDDIHIRPAEPADFEFMVHCGVQAFGNAEDWQRAYYEQTNDDDRATWIATEGATPVGMIRVNFVSDTFGFIHDFSILPIYQGQGMGQNVLALMVNELLERQFTDIRLSVVTENERALRLYQRTGFEVRYEFQYYLDEE